MSSHDQASNPGDAAVPAQTNGISVSGPVGGPLPPASTPMKPHLPPPEVSAVREEEPAPATVHHLPSDDRATAAAAASAATETAASAHPLAAANAPETTASSSVPVEPPAHEADAKGVNGTGIAGTTDQRPDPAPAPAATSSNGEGVASAGQPTAEPASVDAPGTSNPYNQTEEDSITAHQPPQAAIVAETAAVAEKAPAAEAPAAEAPATAAPAAPAPVAPSASKEDVEMKDVSLAQAKVETETPPTANTPSSQHVRRDSMSVDGAQLPLAGPEATDMTANQIKACQNAIKGLKGRTDSSPFHFPVDPVALGIPHYRDHIKQPMDLGTVDIKLALTAAAQKGGNKHTEKTKQAAKWNLDSATDVYRTLEDFERDVRLVFSNCVKFNGPDHPLSQVAQTLDGVFEKQMKSITASIADEGFADVSSATVAAASRRPSEVGAATRPKREVHPPPPKDLPYADRPQSAGTAIGKRRKSRSGLSAREQAWYEKVDKDQLRYILKVIDEFHKSPLKESAWVFFEKPSLELEFAPAYYAMIKNPISLKEIRERIVSGEYEDADGAKEDMELLFSNCFLFNEKDSPVGLMGQEVQRAWESKFAKMPRPNPPIIDEDDEDEDADFDDDDEEENEARIQEIKDQIASLEAQLERLTRKVGKNAAAKKSKKRRNSEAGASAKKAPAQKKQKAASSMGESKKASSKAKKTDNGSKKRDEEIREVTYEQKEELAAKITQLPDDRLDGALKIIAEDKPPNANEDEEIELDIDDLTPQTLYKLYRYVVRPKGKKVTTSKLSSSDGRKRGTGGVKRKNLDEGEEAARIARLQAQLDQFDSQQTLPSGGAGAGLASATSASSKPAAGHDDLVASESSSGEEEYESESDYE